MKTRMLVSVVLAPRAWIACAAMVALGAVGCGDSGTVTKRDGSQVRCDRGARVAERRRFLADSDPLPPLNLGVRLFGALWLCVLLQSRSSVD